MRLFSLQTTKHRFARASNDDRKMRGRKRCREGGDSHVGEDCQQYCGIVSHHVECFQAVFKAGIGRYGGCVAAACTGAAVAQRWDVVEDDAKGVTGDSEKLQDALVRT
jgi:hypothetical protein